MSDWTKVRDTFKIGMNVRVDITSRYSYRTKYKAKKIRKLRIFEATIVGIGETGQLKLLHKDGTVCIKPWWRVELSEGAI